jgi:hypothetical protein
VTHPGRLQIGTVAAFKSEWVAAFKSEYPAGFIGIRTDAHLVNAWGLVQRPNGPFWVSDNGTGFSTLYTGLVCK